MPVNTGILMVTYENSLEAREAVINLDGQEHLGYRLAISMYENGALNNLERLGDI